jgi:peptidyl-prolyl cis-trans isomerase SurA
MHNMSGFSAFRSNRLFPLAVAISLAAAAPALRARIVEQILIRVNSQIVTRADFEKRKATVISGMQQTLKGDELTERMKTVDVDTLRHMADEMLLIERAKQLYDLEKLIDFQQDNFMQNNGLKTKGELEAKLTKEGLTLEQFRDEILHFGVPDFVRSREIRTRLAISGADIEAYYNAHPNEFIGANRRRVREIVLDPSKHEGAALQARRAEIDKALGDKKEEFTKTAGSLSDAANALDGGDMGLVKPRELRAEFDRAIFALKENEVSPPIEAGGKTFWFKVEVIESEGRQPLTVVRDEIEHKLQNERYPAAADKFLNELWRNNYVVVAPEWKAAVTPANLDSEAPVRSAAAPVTDDSKPAKPAKKKKSKRREGTPETMD